MRVYQFRHVSFQKDLQLEFLASGNGIENSPERNYKQISVGLPKALLYRPGVPEASASTLNT